MLLVEPQYAAWSEAEAIPVLERAANGDASAAYQVACYMLSSGDENKRKEAYTGQKLLRTLAWRKVVCWWVSAIMKALV